MLKNTPHTMKSVTNCSPMVNSSGSHAVVAIGAPTLSAATLLVAICTPVDGVVFFFDAGVVVVDFCLVEFLVALFFALVATILLESFVAVGVAAVFGVEVFLADEAPLLLPRVGVVLVDLELGVFFLLLSLL